MAAFTDAMKYPAQPETWQGVEVTGRLDIDSKSDQMFEDWFIKYEASLEVIGFTRASLEEGVDDGTIRMTTEWEPKSCQDFSCLSSMHCLE